MEAFHTADMVVVTPEVVLDSLMKDGTFDTLRAKIAAQLRNHEELKKLTSSMLEQSQVLNTPGAETKPKRELFEALRRELEGPVLERASRAAWEVIVSKEGIGKEIAEIVESVYHRLSGHEQLHGNVFEHEKDSGLEDLEKISDRGLSKSNLHLRNTSQMPSLPSKHSDDSHASGRQHIGVKRERDSVEKMKYPLDNRAGSHDGDTNGHYSQQKGQRTGFSC